MKKIILVAALMLSSVATFAQHEVGSVTLQPKVGLNIANITKGDGNKVRCGVAAGLEFEYQATDIFSVSAGALYSMQGAKNDNTTVQFDYINVPILANVYVAKGLAIKAGVQPGFNIRHKAKVDGTTVDYDDAAKAEGIDSKAKKFDLSIPVGLSYEISNVVLDARYNWGLTKIVSNSDSKNSVFQITLGYKFEL